MLLSSIFTTRVAFISKIDGSDITVSTILRNSWYYLIFSSFSNQCIKLAKIILYRYIADIDRLIIFYSTYKKLYLRSQN